MTVPRSRASSRAKRSIRLASARDEVIRFSESFFRSSSSKIGSCSPAPGKSSVIEADDERVRPPAVSAGQNVGDVKVARTRPQAAYPRLVRHRPQPAKGADAFGVCIGRQRSAFP